MRPEWRKRLENLCHVRISLVGRPGVPDQLVAVFKRKRGLREFMQRYDTQYDVWPWESVRVGWWTNLGSGTTVEYVSIEAWNAGVRWPEFMTWLEE